MIKNLKVKNIALIDDLNVNFENGLTALTGETGAGKSILMESLQLLFGKRTDQDLIRHGTNEAYVSGTFFINKELAKKFDLNQEIEIKVFPNSVNNQVLNISIPNDLKDSSLTAFNIRGQKVLEFQHIPNSLSVSSLNEGLYFFLFSNEEGLNISKKIIIN